MTMRFFIGVKATEASEAGEMPGPELLRAMFEFNQELVAAGVMIDGNGLQPSAAGYKILTVEGETRIVDGPFTETKELISGYWVLQANSVEEAVAWAKRAPMDADGRDAALEIRQIFELEDFPENPDEAGWREAEEKLREEWNAGSPGEAQGSLQPTPGKLVYMGGVDDKPVADPASLKGAKNYVTAALSDIKAGRAVATPVSKPYGCTIKYAE